MVIFPCAGDIASSNILDMLTFRCQCVHCRDGNLAGAQEFHCCREVANASRILTFDRSVECMSCITQHKDGMVLTNRMVLL